MIKKITDTTTKITRKEKKKKHPAFVFENNNVYKIVPRAQILLFSSLQLCV